MVAILENPIIRRQAQMISLAQYHDMIDRGTVDPRTELIRGILVKKMSKSPRHEILTDQIHEWIKGALSDHWVRKEAPLTLADSEPEPDVSVVVGQRRDYAAGHPQTARLVIEVAISSADLDREKGVLYAEAGVAEFWLVLPEEKVVEVHTGPINGAWSNVHRYHGGESFTSTVFPAISIAIDALFSG